jgi:hypothetical protein
MNQTQATTNPGVTDVLRHPTVNYLMRLHRWAGPPVLRTFGRIRSHPDLLWHLLSPALRVGLAGVPPNTATFKDAIIRIR